MVGRPGYGLLVRVMACWFCMFHSLPIGVAAATWRFEPPLGKSSARRGRDILEGHRRLDVSAGGNSPTGSIVVYRRYHFDGHAWVKSERTVQGVWENYATLS